MSVLNSARRGLAVVAGAVAMTLLGATGATAATAVSEDFESSWPTFSIYGSTAYRDCTTLAASGLCSLYIDPTGATRAGARYTPDIAMGSRTRVTFRFMADSTTGDVDADFVLTLNAGNAVLSMTEGVGSNNGVSLHSAGSSAINFASWPSASTWYTATLEFDTATDRVTATVNGSSTTLPISPWATTITETDANAIRWSSYGTAVHYDAIKVETCTTTLLGICVY